MPDMPDMPDDAKALLDSTNFAHVATIMDDGSPQVTPVWVTREGDVAVFNTAKGRLKHRNLERDPRVALSVHDQSNPYTYLQIQGTVEMEDDADKAMIDRLSQKYMGQDYPYSPPGEERVTVRVVADAIDYRPPRG